MTPMLRDSDGDLWEVLPESGYVPQQDENWIRYQDDAMRDAAAHIIGAQIAVGVPESDAAADVWAGIYRDSGHPRVYVREVPHEQSTGASPTRGPRGVYELIAWAGRGEEGAMDPGAMYRALVRPSARWYQEMIEAAGRDLANIAPDDHEAREQIERMADYNQRALAVALRSDRELSVDEMARALTQEG